jgi:hypothetical protein
MATDVGLTAVAARAERRRQGRTCALGSLTLLRFVLGCGSEPDPDVAPFLGSWSFTGGSTVATCGDVRVSQELSGLGADVTETALGEIEYVAGEDCRLRLAVEGRVAKAIGTKSCAMQIITTRAVGQFSSFELELVDDTLSCRSSGSTVLTILVTDPPITVECETFELSGVLKRIAPIGRGGGGGS